MGGMNPAHLLTYLEVLQLIQDEARKAGTQAALADKMGVSPAYLSDILRLRRPLSDRVLEYFGIERDIVYRKKGAQ